MNAIIAALLCCVVAASSISETLVLAAVGADHHEHEHCLSHEHGHDHARHNGRDHDRNRHDDRDHGDGNGCAACAAIKNAADLRALFGAAVTAARVGFDGLFAATPPVNTVSRQTNRFSPVMLRVRLNN